MKLIDKIKELFEDEAVYVEVKTADGRILRASELAVDATVVEVTEEGEVPVEDASYELETGETLVVEGGLIKEINSPEGEAEVVEEMKKVSKRRFTGKRKFAEGADGVETEGEVTVVAESMEEGQSAVVIDEDLVVVEDFTGDVEVEVDGETIEVHLEAGVIDEVKSPEAEEVVEEEFNAVEFAQIFKSEIDKVKESFSKVTSELKKRNEVLAKEVDKLKNSPAEVETAKLKFSEQKNDGKPMSPIEAFVKSKK